MKITRNLWSLNLKYGSSGILILKFECISTDALLLQEDLIDLIPMIAEANAISQELDRKVSGNLSIYLKWCLL